PLLTGAEKGARALVAAIERERPKAYVPTWPWAPLSVLLRFAPLPVLRRFVWRAWSDVPRVIIRVRATRCGPGSRRSDVVVRGVLRVRFGSVSLLPVNGNGPEDVVVDAEGWVFTGLEDGRIIRVSGDGTRIDTIADTGGRPLGIELYGDDGLVVCDSERGLLTVDVASGAVRTLTRSGDGAPLVVCNNAAVAADGTIYFSDSSSRFPVEQWRSDLIEQTGTGRLLRRAPDGTVDTLARGLQ